jgi:hypothetical protein
MNEATFKEQYIVTFLATWAATHYDAYCAAGKQEDLADPPIEDARFLADQTWNHMETI